MSRIAWAQAFPSRPIHLAVAFAPGGIADTIGRAVAQKMSEKVGQPVVALTPPPLNGDILALDVAQVEQPLSKCGVVDCTA